MGIRGWGRGFRTVDPTSESVSSHMLQTQGLERLSSLGCSAKHAAGQLGTDSGDILHTVL